MFGRVFAVWLVFVGVCMIFIGGCAVAGEEHETVDVWIGEGVPADEVQTALDSLNEIAGFDCFTLVDQPWPFVRSDDDMPFGAITIDLEQDLIINHNRQASASWLSHFAGSIVVDTDYISQDRDHTQTFAHEILHIALDDAGHDDGGWGAFAEGNNDGGLYLPPAYAEKLMLLCDKHLDVSREATPEAGVSKSVPHRHTTTVLCGG